MLMTSYQQLAYRSLSEVSHKQQLYNTNTAIVETWIGPKQNILL